MIPGQNELNSFIRFNCDWNKDVSDIEKQSFDHIIHCTFENYIFNNISLLSTFRVECCISLLYRCKSPELLHTALTIIDGSFFSLYPYYEDIYTLTHVDHTVVFPDIASYDFEITPDILSDRKTRMETCVLDVFPSFLQHFEYHSYFISFKCKKRHTVTDDRSVVLLPQTQKEIFVCGGKITGIFEAYKSIYTYIINSPP